MSYARSFHRAARQMFHQMCQESRYASRSSSGPSKAAGRVFSDAKAASRAFMAPSGNPILQGLRQEQAKVGMAVHRNNFNLTFTATSTVSNSLPTIFLPHVIPIQFTGMSSGAQSFAASGLHYSPAGSPPSAIPNANVQVRYNLVEPNRSLGCRWLGGSSTHHDIIKMNPCLIASPMHAGPDCNHCSHL